MKCIAIVVLCAAICFIDCSATTRLPNSWNRKDCVNSEKVKKARNECAKDFTQHDAVERCVLMRLEILDGNERINVDSAKKLIGDYTATTAIKFAMVRDINECCQVRHNNKRQMTCLFQVLTKRCLMRQKA